MTGSVANAGAKLFATMPAGRDTDAAADAVQMAAYRRMGGTARAEIASRLTAASREATEGGIRARHPDYDDARVKLALARLLYGDELVQKAWPGHSLVEP